MIDFFVNIIPEGRLKHIKCSLRTRGTFTMANQDDLINFYFFSGDFFSFSQFCLGPKKFIFFRIKYPTGAVLIGLEISDFVLAN